MMVANYDTVQALKKCIGQPLDYSETSMFGIEYKSNGTFALVGPSAHKRDWFVAVTMENDLIIKIESD